MTSARARINRNRRKRIHAAELRRHEREVDGVASTPWPRPAGAHPQHTTEPIVDRDIEERQWRETWEVDQP